jgi:mannose-6-phosphate isomerase-like protein (cupin superfamily)
MNKENLAAKRGTFLRRNDRQELSIKINKKAFSTIFLINGPDFLAENISLSNLIIKPYDHYMIINNSSHNIDIHYDLDISSHKIIYDPYKYEHRSRINLQAEDFIREYKIPNGYIDTLSKWYSFKFTYSKYNLIFIKPEMGLSIQTHKYRSENWEVLEGEPIILSSNRMHYYVNAGSKFQNLKNTYHTVINPNKDQDKFILIKEYWSGKFDEEDITRVFNPNGYT